MAVGSVFQDLLGVDWKALAVAITAIGAAGGAVITGIYTGRNTRRNDNNAFQLAREKAKLDRETSEDQASKARIDAVIADAADARKRLREAEDDFDLRLAEMRTRIRDVEKDRDRGWDLARHHFGMVSMLDHLLNNIFTVASMGANDERIALTVKNQIQRLEGVRVPLTLEEPIPRTEVTSAKG